MPDYSYNKDYPFAAFITNLGKYNAVSYTHLDVYKRQSPTSPGPLTP